MLTTNIATLNSNIRVPYLWLVRRTRRAGTRANPESMDPKRSNIIMVYNIYIPNIVYQY